MAARFWVGGTATWDASNTTPWAATTGGAGGQSVPGTGDTVTFDGSSGGGTVTVNAVHSISSLTTSSFTGTIDFSANNNNINIGTVTAAATAWTDNGAGTHTINMGNSTWSIDSTGTLVNFAAGAGLTLNANSSTISTVARANVSRAFAGNGKTFNVVTLNGAASSVYAMSTINVVIGTLTLTNQAILTLANNITVTTLSITSSASLPVGIRSATIGAAKTITLTNSLTPSYISLQDITFSGGTNTASNSFDFGNNTGITITGPTGGGTAGMLFIPDMAGT